MKLFLKSFVFLGLLSCSSTQNGKNFSLAVQQSPEQKQNYQASGSKFVIATQGQAATEAAKAMFKLGGNIIDAAVAASFVISVERPQSTGIGGGGFMLFKDAQAGKTYAIDFRERAPLRSYQKMYLDKKGEVIKGLSSEGHQASAVPGLVAGLLEIHQKFGKLTRAQVMQPSIDLAEGGVKVYEHLATALADRQELLKKYRSSSAIFLKKDGSAYKVGDVLVQRDLGKTLRKIAAQGATAFYKGAIASAIAKESQRKGGFIQLSDLSNYQTKWREPVSGSFKGYKIHSMPPPSSGGTHVVEILNIVEGDPLQDWGPSSEKTLHLKAAAMQQAFADRASYMGDPDYYKQIPVKGLSSKAYAQNIREHINLDLAHKSESVKAGEAPKYESTETTHFSLMDSEGNAVASTQTINGWMGSGVTVPGTGILLNNEMDDFAAKPGDANIYGAIGGVPNAIEAGKTPLSSMAPTIITKDNVAIMALGAPGGTRIITCVAQTALNYLEHRMSLYDSVAAVRMHHQWQPDQLDLESPGPGAKVVSKLERMGYKVVVGKIPCRVNAVANENGVLKGAADPRDLGASYAE